MIYSIRDNHVLDWGYAGLLETLQTLKESNIKSAGAGRNRSEAAAPAVMNVAGKGRVIVFSLGSETSGIPMKWAAGANSAGVNLVPDLSDKTVRAIQSRIREWKRLGDIVVASIHWGGNWGYAIPHEETEFAHILTMPVWISFTDIHPITPKKSKSTMANRSFTAAAILSTTMRGSADTSSSGATWA